MHKCGCGGTTFIVFSYIQEHSFGLQPSSRAESSQHWFICAEHASIYLGGRCPPGCTPFPLRVSCLHHKILIMTNLGLWQDHCEHWAQRCTGLGLIRCCPKLRCRQCLIPFHSLSPSMGASASYLGTWQHKSSFLESRWGKKKTKVVHRTSFSGNEVHYLRCFLANSDNAFS